MDEHRLEVFAAVARRLNFSDAGRILHLSQPAVSQQVAALEAELGAKLFERTTRKVRLTAAGVALLARSDSLLREHAEARRAVAAAEGRIAGELRIAASLTRAGSARAPMRRPPRRRSRRRRSGWAVPADARGGSIRRAPLSSSLSREWRGEQRLFSIS